MFLRGYTLAGRARESTQVDSFPGLGKEMISGRDFSPENRPALDDIYGVKNAAGIKKVAA